MKYLVDTTGVTGRCVYEAQNPDEALMFAYRHERFQRIKRENPKIPPREMMELIVSDSDISDFIVISCILKESH